MRAKLGLTQDDLAKKADADIKYAKPIIQTMAKIAKALGVQEEYQFQKDKLEKLIKKYKEIK